MEQDFAKSAGEVVEAALVGRTGGEPRKKTRGARYKPEYWNLLNLSVKLCGLTENWRAVAGEPLASRSAPAVCEEAEGRLLITVNVPDQMVLSSARFRKARLERGISAFFGGAAVSVDFRVGPILRQARPARSAPQQVYRRAPVVNSEEEIAEREKFFIEGGVSPELASSMARVMLSLEKLSNRKKRLPQRP
ncbi:MAG TPA: hypothetical protein IAC22_06180 [Candidatus Caccocola faecipullorum]|nr:hypothetical protein [Candidatus Caccocola faecipullorum]